MGCNNLIRISDRTKQELERQKDFKKESYDDVIVKLINNKEENNGRE